MLISFEEWRRAERRKFGADLRALKQRGGRSSRHGRRLRLRWPRWSPLRRSTLLILLFAGLVVAGAAWTPPPTMIEPATMPSPVVLRPATPSRIALSAPNVIDGDTLRMGSRTIRLHGIDAPESLQTCADGWRAGQAARAALVRLVAAGTPLCEHATTDVYGRTVAVCRVDGEDIGAAMVRKGMAWAEYSVRYLPQQWAAWFEGLGVHARRCISPATWRDRHPW